MIYINHERKAIFLHIPKTGGSYIGPTLVKYYGFTSYLHLLYGRRPDHAEACQLHRYRPVPTGNPKYDRSFFNKHLGLLRYCKTSPELNHAMNMTEDKWNQYTKFCFVRNPYDRAISGWKHLSIVLHRTSDFHTYITQPCPAQTVSNIEYGHLFMSQTKQIEDETGECGVDIIGRFEHLEEDFTTILHHLGFETLVHDVVKVNVSNHTTETSSGLLLQRTTVDALNQLFQDDFQRLHYLML